MHSPTSLFLVLLSAFAAQSIESAQISEVKADQAQQQESKQQANRSQELSANSIALLQAAHQGDCDAIERLLQEKDTDINATQDGFGTTPLHAAILAGYYGCAHLLLARRANVNAKDATGDTPLSDLMTNKDIAAVQELIELLVVTYKADINTKNNLGVTPLMRAGMFNKRRMAAQLIKLGADESVKNIYGRTYEQLRNSADWARPLRPCPVYMSTEDESTGDKK